MKNPEELQRNKGTGRIIKVRTLIMMFIFGVAAFIPLVVALYNIQIKDHNKYEQLAIEQQTIETAITASRGTIYDRNGNALAISAAVETVYISPRQIAENEKSVELIAAGLSNILDVSYEGIVEKANNTSSWYQTIKTKIEKELADEVRTFITENDLSGCVDLVEDTKRYYPYSTLACHVIGFVGTDNYGLEGIEAIYEETLKGSNGIIISAQNGKGTEMLYQYEQYFDAEDGDSVSLTLDLTIQYYVEKHLQEAIENYDILNGAAAIAMDPKTAQILAMASYGNYDLNNYSVVSDEDTLVQLEELEGDEYYDALAQAQYKQWRNKALSDTYEPGSTFKIITLAMALEEGIVNSGNSFYCSGAMDVKGRDAPVHCWKTAGHGSQTLAEAVGNSCNMAFVNMGLNIGADTFYDYVEAFGLFDTTGIDLAGESGSLWWSKDIFADPDNFSSLAVAAFGQTFNITPIQLVTAISAAVNGGYLMEPYVVSEVLNSDGEVLETTEPKVIRQVISEETSALVREILENVVADGTGGGASVTGYRIGGKTGTSEKVGAQSEDKIVSFVGIAPADDPEIVLLVLLDTPSTETGIYISGGQMAAPTAGSILADVLPYMGIEPEYTEEELENLDVSVPKVEGNTIDEAESKLQERDLTYRVIGSGDTVTTQIPASGSKIPAGSEVILYMGDVTPPETVTVPDFTGRSVSGAYADAAYVGVYLKMSGTSSTESSVVVSSQSIAAGTEVEPGTVVEVKVVDTSVLD